MRTRALYESKIVSHSDVKENLDHELLPVYQDSGAYYIDMFVGTPPQRQTVMIDTGSENVAIPCTGCQDCGTHIDTQFEKLQSTSFEELHCNKCLDGLCSKNNTCYVNANYLEGSSWAGTEVQDYIYPTGKDEQFLNSRNLRIRKDNKFPLKFACMSSNEGEFKRQKADGIMGLNRDKASFWNQMHAAGAINSKQFSLCVRKFPYVPIKQKMIGAMTLGGVDERLNSSEMKYMDLEENGLKSMFPVQIRKIHVHAEGGSRLSGSNPDIDLRSTKISLATDDATVLNSKSVIVDSGTTDSILPIALKPAFDKVWKELMGISFPSEAVELSVEELKKWPTILFQMKGSETNANGFDKQNPKDILVAFPPSSYMRLDLVKKMYEPSLTMKADVEVSILGSNFMRGHNVLFDIDNSRIGIAESTCDYKLAMTGEAESEFIDPYPTIDEISAAFRRNYLENACEIDLHLCCVLFILKVLLPIVSTLLFLLTFIYSKTTDYNNKKR